MRRLIFSTLLLAASTEAFALVAVPCHLRYTPSIGAPVQSTQVSGPSFPKQIPGVSPAAATTVFPADGVVQSVTAASQDDGAGHTTLVITVDLENGQFGSNDTVFSNSFVNYQGDLITTSILRPEGQVRFNFPTPPPVPGQPPTPPIPPQPLTFTGSAAWGPAATTALKGLVINHIQVECGKELPN
jgi:hypothetical protein